jgi:hypothetical protein
MHDLPHGYGPAAEAPPPEAPCWDCGRLECQCPCPMCDAPGYPSGAWCPDCQAGNDYLAELPERDFVRLGRTLREAALRSGPHQQDTGLE